jgi:hypothetical protein
MAVAPRSSDRNCDSSRFKVTSFGCGLFRNRNLQPSS